MTDTTDTRVHFPHLAAMQALVGQHLATSPWVLVDQQRINLFAEATGDHQWIHVDVERATREMGGPIAHGYLTLSLIPFLGAGLLLAGGAVVAWVHVTRKKAAKAQPARRAALSAAAADVTLARL